MSLPKKKSFKIKQFKYKMEMEIESITKGISKNRHEEFHESRGTKEK